MDNKIKLILVDDHPIIVLGMEHIISLEDDIEIVGKAINGSDALSLIESRDVDIAVLDISMPVLNGLDTAELIKKTKPEVKIVLITMYDNKDYIDRAKSIGVEGYILKEDAPDIFVKVIRNIMNGFVDYRVPEARMLSNPPDHVSNLTNRETQIVRLIAMGKSTKNIAEGLNISPKTVNWPRKRINNKLQVKSSADLYRFAYKYKLIDPNLVS